MDHVVRQRPEKIDRPLQGRRAGRRAYRLVHQRQNCRDRNLQGRQARGRLEALGPRGIQELGRDLPGRQENLMTAVRATNVTILDADLSRAEHQDALVTMLDGYMRDPMEGGAPMSEGVKRELIPGLRAHPACYVFLAYRDGSPVGFTICFLGFSTFLARPLINIHDIFVDSSVRGLGIGAMLLERIEAKARELNCCRITLEVGEDNHVARGLYRTRVFDRVVVGEKRVPMEMWRKPL